MSRDRLPKAVAEIAQRWSLSLGAPYEASCARVAPAIRPDGTPVVLKLGMLHTEGRDEMRGL